MNRVFRRRVAGVLLPMALLGLLSLGVTGASATVKHDWGEHFVVAGAGYTDPTGHTNEVGNVVLYEGAGESHLCERVNNLSTGTVQEACGVNGAGGAEIVKSWLGFNLQNAMRNNGTHDHTYHGYWFSP